ncbi:haloacid dehalogenase-like hydrolase [Seiridium cupressi]
MATQAMDTRIASERVQCSGLLFDLDGTLIDSTKAVIKHWDTVGAEIGVDPALILQTAHGRRTIDTLKAFCPGKANWKCEVYPSPTEACCNSLLIVMTDVGEMEALIPKLYGQDAVTINGARELLQAIIAVRVPWAIVTSGSNGLARGWLETLQLPHPEHLVTAESVEHGKPDPSCYRMGAEILNMSPAKTVVFEDSPAGIRAGKAANCKVVGLVTSHTLDEIVAAGPDWVVRDLQSVKLIDYTTGMVSLQFSDIYPTRAGGSMDNNNNNNGHRPVRRTIQSNEAYMEIVRTARELCIRAALLPAQKRRVLEAVTILEMPQMSQKRQQYRMFLHDVHSKCGIHGVLLCAVTLGQHRTTTMRKGSRFDLVDKLSRCKDDSTINCSVTRSLAEEHGIPQKLKYAEPMEPQSPTAFYGTGSGVYGDMGCNDTVFECRASNPKSKPREYVPLEVVGRVFNDEISGIIRKVPVKDNNIIVYSAAIVVNFPNSGAVECLLSIDVEGWAINRLTKTLFNTETCWPDPSRCVISSAGARLTILNPDVTMTGARNETLLEVFGPELYQAIHESSIRKRELEVHKQKTECVSISFTDGGAILNLSLSLKAGIDIQNKLFNS